MVKFEIQKKQFQQLLKSHSNFSTKVWNTILTNLYIIVKGDNLIFYSTNGNVVLKSQIKLNEKYRKFEALYPLGILSKLKFIKGNIDSCIDNLEIKMTKKEMVIFDMCNKFTYKIQGIDGKYPNVEKVYQLHNKGFNYQFALNSSYLCALKDLNINPRTLILDLFVNSNDELSPIGFKAQDGDNEITQEGLIMPIKKY